MKFPRLTSDYSRRQRMISLLLGCIIGLAAAAFFAWNGRGFAFTEKLDQTLFYDYYFNHFHHSAGLGLEVGDDSKSQVETTDALISNEAAQKIAIVVVDDKTLERGLQWPLPRSMYLDVVKRLEKAGARTIGLDILFGAPGPDPAADELLKEALARPSVVLPYTLQDDEGRVHAGGVYPPLLEGWTEEDFSRRFGFTMEIPDDDKKVRRGVLAVETPDMKDAVPFYSFDAVVLGHFLGLTPDEVVKRTRGVVVTPLSGYSTRTLGIFGRIAYLAPDIDTRATLVADAPKEAYQEGKIQFIQEGNQGEGPLSESAFLDQSKHQVRNLANYLTIIPLYRILEAPEKDLPGMFGMLEDPRTGKQTPNEVIALVGVTVSGGHDLKESPLGAISGVAIHANILINLLQDNFLRAFTTRDSAMLILCLALLASVSGSMLEPKVATTIVGLSLYGLFLGGQYAFENTYRTGGQMIPLAYPFLTSSVTFLAVTVYAVTAQKAAKDKFAKILQEVAPIPDLEALLGKDGLKVGSEERNLTILFSDIRGYTDLSESLDPVTVTEMLNAYHQAMGEVFDRYGGIIFDYQGDAQMVVFGLVPNSQPNHAAAACKAGVGMVLRLEKLRQEWQAQGRPVFETGVGICTGPVAIGVLGSAQRKQYAAIGDATNTAARMQGKSKDLDSPVLITESTYTEAGDEIIADYIGAEKVKGKREPLQVYGCNLREMEQKMGVSA